MKIRVLLTYVIISTLLTIGCQNSQMNSTPINPISDSEYEFFAKNYKGDTVKEGFELNEISSKKYTETYKSEPANYEMKAYGVQRSGSNRPAALLIEMKMDRIQSSLMGNGKRKTETKYICLPSGESPAASMDAYTKEIRSLGYKDFEVYTSFLSSVFAEMSF